MDDSVTENLRVLVAEDEFLVGLMLEENLKYSGWDVVGPVASLEGLLSTIADQHFDIAVLDVNLNGTMVFPALEAIARKGRPVILVTGYGAKAIQQGTKVAAVFAKPYDYALLEAQIRKCTAGNS